MKKTIYAALIFAAFGMTACGGNEVEEDTQAGEEQVVVEENNYTLNSESSKLEWRGTWVVAGNEVKNHFGTVEITSGDLVQKGDHYSGNFTIDMATINAEDLAEDEKDKAKLEGHLQGEEFFNVGEYAKVNVTLNGITDGVADLTIEALGKKFNQDASVEVMTEGDQLMLHGEFSVNFAMFNMPMMQHNEEDGNVNPEVGFKLHLVVDKQ